MITNQLITRNATVYCDSKALCMNVLTRYLTGSFIYTQCTIMFVRQLEVRLIADTSIPVETCDNSAAILVYGTNDNLLQIIEGFLHA